MFYQLTVCFIKYSKLIEGFKLIAWMRAISDQKERIRVEARANAAAVMLEAPLSERSTVHLVKASSPMLATRDSLFSTLVVFWRSVEYVIT